jgi:hypothetical protein
MNPNVKLSLFAAFVAITLQSQASEQVFTDLNFAITPPNNWKALTNTTQRPGTFVVAYGAPERGRVLLVTVDSSRKPTGPMDEKFIEDFDQGTEKGGGGKRVSGKFIEMDGVKAFERTSNPLVLGRQTSTMTHAVLTSERFYNVQGVTLKNVADDADIQKALASFRFLTPAHEPRLSAETAAYRIGYIMGKYGAMVVIVAGVVFTVVKNRKIKPPPFPPTA